MIDPSPIFTTLAEELLRQSDGPPEYSEVATSADAAGESATDRIPVIGTLGSE